MQELKVIGVENGSLLVASDDGAQYRVEVDETVQSRLRASMPDPGPLRRLAPREIQAQIRAGMTAEDVARVTGASLEYIKRFEGPVLAEREYVVESALNVPVHIAVETDPLASGATFGSVIRERLAEAGATGERWASWKEEGSGWVVKLSFTAEQIDHDARWRFDPRKSALAPLNNEAETLSRQGELTGSLIPRLRAVDARDRVADESRFDSGAFAEHDLTHESAHESAQQDTAPHLEAVPYGRIGAASEDTSAPTAPTAPAVQTAQTADLLEALRRRRGERESAQYDDLEEAMADHPSTGSIRLVEVPLPDLGDDEHPTAPQPAVPQSIHSRSSKRGRAAMPSWDEIVFGARSDDDPA
jgi:hypothetical protein